MRKRATWVVLSTVVLLAGAAAPAMADGQTAEGCSGGTQLKAMWMDATATAGGWLAGLFRPDRPVVRDVAGLGSTLDPDGNRADVSPAIDPNGHAADDGVNHDPDGHRAEGGPDLDPNG